MSNIADRVINKLDTLVANSITEKRLLKQQQEANVLASILKMEMHNQQLYRAEMLDKNLTLDPEDQTDGYMQFASLAGDSVKTDGIASTLINMQMKNAGMYTALQDYNEGSALADTLLAGDYSKSPGEKGVAQYMFSPEELEAAEKSGAITAEQAANPNIMQGLNISTEDAFKYMQYENSARHAVAQMELAELKLNEKQLTIANQGYHSALGNAGNLILNKMSFQIPPQLADQKLADFNLTKFINLKNTVPGASVPERADHQTLLDQYDAIERSLLDPTLFHPDVSSSILKALNHYSMTENISGVNNAHTQFGYLAPLIKKDFDAISAYEANAIQSGLIAGTIDEKDGELVEEELDFLATNDDVYKEMKFKVDSWASLGLAIDESILQNFESFQKSMESRIDDKQNELFTRAVGEDTFDYDMYNSYPGSYDYKKTQDEFEDGGEVDLLYQDSFIPGTEPVIDIPADNNLLMLASELEAKGTIDPDIQRLEEINIWLEENPESYATTELAKESYATMGERNALIQEKDSLEQEINRKRYISELKGVTGLDDEEAIIREVQDNPAKYLQHYYQNQ